MLSKSPIIATLPLQKASTQAGNLSRTAIEEKGRATTWLSLLDTRLKESSTPIIRQGIEGFDLEDFRRANLFIIDCFKFKDETLSKDDLEYAIKLSPFFKEIIVFVSLNGLIAKYMLNDMDYAAAEEKALSDQKEWEVMHEEFLRKSSSCLNVKIIFSNRFHAEEVYVTAKNLLATKMSEEAKSAVTIGKEGSSSNNRFQTCQEASVGAFINNHFKKIFGERLKDRNFAKLVTQVVTEVVTIETNELIAFLLTVKNGLGILNYRGKLTTLMYQSLDLLNGKREFSAGPLIQHKSLHKIFGNLKRLKEQQELRDFRVVRKEHSKPSLTSASLSISDEYISDSNALSMDSESSSSPEPSPHNSPPSSPELITLPKTTSIEEDKVELTENEDNFDNEESDMLANTKLNQDAKSSKANLLYNGPEVSKSSDSDPLDLDYEIGKLAFSLLATGLPEDKTGKFIFSLLREQRAEKQRARAEKAKAASKKSPAPTTTTTTPTRSTIPPTVSISSSSSVVNVLPVPISTPKPTLATAVSVSASTSKPKVVLTPINSDSKEPITHTSSTSATITHIATSTSSSTIMATPSSSVSLTTVSASENHVSRSSSTHAISRPETKALLTAGQPPQRRYSLNSFRSKDLDKLRKELKKAQRSTGEPTSPININSRRTWPTSDADAWTASLTTTVPIPSLHR